MICGILFFFNSMHAPLYQYTTLKWLILNIKIFINGTRMIYLFTLLLGFYLFTLNTPGDWWCNYSLLHLEWNTDYCYFHMEIWQIWEFYINILDYKKLFVLFHGCIIVSHFELLFYWIIYSLIHVINTSPHPRPPPQTPIMFYWFIVLISYT